MVRDCSPSDGTSFSTQRFRDRPADHDRPGSVNRPRPRPGSGRIGGVSESRQQRRVRERAERKDAGRTATPAGAGSVPWASVSRPVRGYTVEVHRHEFDEQDEAVVGFELPDRVGAGPE